ncbi:P-loop containing nucleoside triphosphate hydrolase protein [Suhomyces tanzawaensis NRRL Y-17324]|uniref:p-loop containing nucleoside triphosphate hydrolase protein n=1 Tax=Suhomyces tanzawaensis NRRL Y-17324 TaxID=984487 RepID=A0A1E4SDB9_9ASCO|nr:P-loop containing nucleoside triphosphate hydrolase protein [Suhomyces tanzawaensis NRRL Y-17324]ODV77509.1 P-loop containing nucleoside triphosphate hydrolase protein [Suhomyces tanzawaensis NRRL Y-17324]
MLKLRDYQVNAIESVHNAIARGIRRPAVVLATGGGKTVVFSHIIKDLAPLLPSRGNKTLVLAHKEELVHQAAKTISSTYPEAKVDIDMRNLKPSSDAEIIVGSVPTLIRSSRLEKYNPSEFKAIILDECHHATASSWLKILKYFGADTASLEIYVLGFTATLERNDGKNLGEIFDEIVYERSLLEMVKNKELVDVKFSSIDVHVDLDKVASRKDDYQISSLSEAMNTADVNSVVALSYIKLQKEFNFKSTLIFCVDINHCKTLCGVLQKQGINAQYITGETSKHERRAIIDDFKSGIINVLCNVQVFTEGTDIPNIDSLFLARPTKSRVLLVQMIGRGLRLYKGKSHCHVIDIAGTKGTGIQSVPTLFSLPPDYVIHGKSYEQLTQEKEQYDLEQEQLKKENLNKEQALKLLEMQKKSEQLFEMEDLVQSVDLNVSTYDGFLALEKESTKKYQLVKVVNEEFSNNYLPWIRLEYDLWGLLVDQLHFLLIRKLVEGDTTKWNLSLNRFASNAQLVSSSFMCPRQSVVSDISTSTNLQSLLIDAEKLATSIDKSFRFRVKDFQKPLTPKQASYLIPKMIQKLNQFYDVTTQMEESLKDQIQGLSKKRAGGLIFAFKYSKKSLWIRWELQKMVGPDRKALSTMKKMTSIQREIKELKEQIVQ